MIKAVGKGVAEERKRIGGKDKVMQGPPSKARSSGGQRGQGEEGGGKWKAEVGGAIGNMLEPGGNRAVGVFYLGVTVPVGPKAWASS